MKRSALFFLLLLVGTATIAAQQDSSQVQVRGIQYASAEDALKTRLAKPIPLFAGLSVSVDLCGAAMASLCPWGQYEAAARVNFRQRYFPTIEIGVGSSNHTDETTNLHYKTHSPFFRGGCDLNIANDKRSGNRIYLGLRYGFSAFKYNLDGPDIEDPVYGETLPYRFVGVNGRMHWAEIVGGLEARIWRFVHLGWTLRYKLRIHEKQNSLGHAWYVPGFGKNAGGRVGGTFNLIFDID